MQNTKKIESKHFSYFKNLVCDLPDGEVCHEDKPDFWIYTSSRILGIEHSLILKSEEEKARESQENDIALIAQEHGKLQGLPNLDVNVIFNLPKILPKKQRKPLARKMVRIIQNKLKTVKLKELESCQMKYPELPEQLSYLRFCKVTNDMEHLWHCSRAGWGLNDCQKLIQRAIDDKARKYSNYLENCSECWLLIAADSQPSSFIHPSSDALDYKYHSPFERNYFLDCSRGKLFLLKSYKK